jgi:hypothetical protein
MARPFFMPATFSPGRTLHDLMKTRFRPAIGISATALFRSVRSSRDHLRSLISALSGTLVRYACSNPTDAEHQDTGLEAATATPGPRARAAHKSIISSGVRSTRSMSDRLTQTRNDRRPQAAAHFCTRRNEGARASGASYSKAARPMLDQSSCPERHRAPVSGSSR